MIFHVDIARVDLERAERFAAVDIELAEELQALQTQVMHEAAEQVQAEVEQMAQQEDDDKDQHDTTVTPPLDGIAARVLNTCAMTLPASIRAMSREYERMSPNQPVRPL